MSEQSLPPTPPGPVGWAAELLTRLPSHTFMAGLFVYFILVIQPGRESWYWDTIQEQRANFALARKEDEERTARLLVNANQQCNDAIKAGMTLADQRRTEATQILEEQEELIKGLYLLVEKTCTRLP